MRVRKRFIALTAALSVVLVALLLVAAFLFLAPGAYPDEFRHRLTETGPAAQVVDLHDIQQLSAAFNQDDGTPRLVVLFSPT
jgi:hypothetical protein